MGYFMSHGSKQTLLSGQGVPSGNTRDRIKVKRFLLSALFAVIFAGWLVPAAVAQTLVGSVYEGKVGVGDPLADVRATFGDNDQLTWEILGTWAYYDEEDEYLYHFPSISTSDGTYDYDSGSGTLEFDSEWSGDIETVEDADYHCTYTRVRSSASGLSVSPDGSSITGAMLQSGDFYYEGYGSWSDTNVPGTVDLTRVSGGPTATPTNTPQPPIHTPTPNPTATPTPGETSTPGPQPTAQHPEFDANDDNLIDAEDLFLFMKDWHHHVGTGD